ncbi:hypothetical protein ACHWQZ_G017781 [Mnemiopsis leidyi]
MVIIRYKNKLQHASFCYLVVSSPYYHLHLIYLCYRCHSQLIDDEMKSSAGKSKTFPRGKVHNDGGGKYRSRDKISRAMKRFVHSDKDKVHLSGDSKEDSCHEKNSLSPSDSAEEMKSQKLSEIKDKKKMKKRASVAILVDKLESEVRAVKSKVSRVKLRKSSHLGSLDECGDCQKVQLTSLSLPPKTVRNSCTSTESEDREVELILSSSCNNKGSDDELFVPRGFNSSKLLKRKQAQRRKDFRGWIKSDSASPNLQRSDNDVISSCKPSPDITDSGSGVLPISKHKLKAGDMASILKNRKTDNRSSENVPESVEGKNISCDLTVSDKNPVILERQRSQSEQGTTLETSDLQEIELLPTKSAPSAAFFLNNGSPLSSASQPNLSKVLEAEGKEEQNKELVYEGKDRVTGAATPPLQRQYEEPLQGFHVIRTSSFQPRDLSSTPPRSIIVPKARTPMSSSYQEKLSSVENLLCEIVTRLDQLECCSRHGVNKRITKQTRHRETVSLRVRMSREQQMIRKHLYLIDKRTALLAKKVDRINSQTQNRVDKSTLQFDDILKSLQIEDFRALFEKEHISKEEFFLLKKSDLKELGLPLGIRKRILNYIKQ